MRLRSELIEEAPEEKARVSLVHDRMYSRVELEGVPSFVRIDFRLHMHSQQQPLLSCEDARLAFARETRATGRDLAGLSYGRPGWTPLAIRL